MSCGETHLRLSRPSRKAYPDVPSSLWMTTSWQVTEWCDHVLRRLPGLRVKIVMLRKKTGTRESEYALYHVAKACLEHRVRYSKSLLAGKTLLETVFIKLFRS